MSSVIVMVVPLLKVMIVPQVVVLIVSSVIVMIEPYGVMNDSVSFHKTQRHSSELNRMHANSKK